MPIRDSDQGDAMARVAASGLETSLSALRHTLSTLQAAGAGHAQRCSLIAEKLDHARQSLETVQAEGRSLRLMHKMLAELDAVRKLLEGGTQRSVPILEEICKRYMLPNQPIHSRVAKALAEVVNVAEAKHEGEFRAWARSAGELLFAGARALALAPPGGLSEGIDGLEKERMAMDQANALFASAERIDGLRAAIRTRAHDEEADAVATSGVVIKCHTLFHADVAARVIADLQTACRLAAHATSASPADAAILLEAMAEASSTSAKAVRCVASVFGLVQAPPASAAATAGTVSLEGIQQMATDSDALLASLRALPSAEDSARGAALRGLGSETSELMRRQLEASDQLVVAAQTVRGRRILSILGEAGERLAAAARTQAVQQE